MEYSLHMHALTSTTLLSPHRLLCSFKSRDRFDGLVLPAYLISSNQALREKGCPVLFVEWGGGIIVTIFPFPLISFFHLLLHSSCFARTTDSLLRS